VAPVLDPATRTAQIEVEITNINNRLKPGMYARVHLTTEQRNNALVVPSNAVVDRDGQRGVFLANANNTAAFRPIQVGIEETAHVEVLGGVSEKDQVITTGAAALQNGDRIVLAGQGDGASPPRPAGGRPGQAREGGPRQRPSR
jgi:multidrug efflux pump subunit AcrA (membrane-fusion protein)